MSGSAERIYALVMRHIHIWRSSIMRLVDSIYWPAVQMLMWGFLQTYIAEQASMFAKAGGLLVGAVLLWDILFRGQLGFSVSFLEEMYARNLGNLMMSYDARQNSRGLLEDLQKLLRLSHIG